MTADDLPGFLLARIAEDEWDALPFRNPAGVTKRWRADEIGGKVRQIGPTEFGLPDVVSQSDTHLTAAHIARHHPARVLAECAAKRAIVELHSVDHGCPDASGMDGYTWVNAPRNANCQTLRLLALPYADHPDFRPEWARADG